MSNPLHTIGLPSTLVAHHVVGVWCFLEVHRRILGGAFGRIPEHLSSDAFNMAGYCIDAPSLLPAGSTYFDSFGPEPDDWNINLRTFEREPEPT